MADRKTVLITGVSSGIGYAITRRLSGNQNVIGVFRTENRHTQDLRARGVELIQVDLLKDVEAIEKLLGARNVEILINNAGKMHLERLVDHDESIFREIFEINFWVPLRLVRKMLSLSGANGAKRTINISSMCQWISSPFLASYIASKRALEGATEALRMEDGSQNFQVCSVEPGFVKTEMYKYLENWLSSRSEDAKDLKFMKEKFHLIPHVSEEFLCDKIEHLMALKKMPLRLPVGHFSVEQIVHKLESWNSELPEWKRLNPAPTATEQEANV